MKQSIFQQNSRSLLGMNCLTPDRVNVKKNQEEADTFSNKYMISSGYSMNKNGSLNKSNNELPRIVSSDRSIQINYEKLNKQYDVKKSKFSDSQSTLPSVNKQDIIDWVSGNSSLKYEDIMKNKSQSIKLHTENSNNSFNSIDQSKLQNDLSNIDMTSSIIVRRTRKAFNKQIDQDNSFQNNNSAIYSPQNAKYYSPQNKNTDYLQNQQQSSQEINLSGQSKFFRSQNQQPLQINENNSKTEYLNQNSQFSQKQDEIRQSYNLSQFKQNDNQSQTKSNFMIKSIKKTNEDSSNKQETPYNISINQDLSNKSSHTSIDKIFDEFMQHSSESSIFRVNKSQQKNNKDQEDKKNILSPLIPQLNQNENAYQLQIRPRKVNKQSEKTEDVSQYSYQSKLLTESDIDDYSYNRPKSITFDLNESKNTTQPSTSTSLSNYKSILKNPKQQMLDFFGDLVDSTKSPSSKRVQFAD